MTEEIITTGEKFYCFIQDIEEYIQYNNLEQDEELDWILKQAENLQSDYQRLKQENEALKGIDGNVNPDSAYYKIRKLEQENEKLKEEIQFHNKENTNLLAERNAAQIGYDEIREVRERYRKALEEIKVIADDTFHCCDDDCGNARKIKLILDKINEVL